MTVSTLNRARPADVSTIVTGALATLAIAGSMLIAELTPAWAQHTVIARQADGPNVIEGGQMFVLPAIPNRFEALTRPEFSRRDVPLFHEHLSLDESQMYVLQVLLDSYTEQFQAAVDEFREVQKHYRMKIPGMEGEFFGGGMMGETLFGGLDEMIHVDEGEDGTHIVDLGDDMTFVFDSPGTVSVGVTQSVNLANDVEITDDGDGPPQFMVSLRAEDETGESLLSDERIQEISDHIIKKMQERLAEIEARRLEIEAQQAIAEARRQHDPDATQQEEAASAEDVARAGRKLIDERNRLRDELVTDVKLLLNDEQKEQWPAFERAQRRISSMRLAEFGGEGVDVLRIINEQQPTAADAAAIESAKQQYAIELDEALRNRNELLPEYEIELLLMTDEMIQSQSMDNEDRLKLMDKVGDARAAVRDANLHAAEVMKPLLAEESRDEFMDAVRRRAYPHLYNITLTQRSIEVAGEFEDLDAETRTAIETLEREYTTQLAVLNDRIAAEIRKTEPREHRRMVESLDEIRAMEANREAGEDVDFPVFASTADELTDDRRSLNKRTMDQLRGLLTEEQIAELPTIRRRMPDFGPAVPRRGAGVSVIRTETKRSDKIDAGE